MANILYIHGFGSDSNSSTAKEIEKGLGDNHKVITYSFNNDYELAQTMVDNINIARELIKENKIDLVVGTSMGAFIAMNCHDVAKVLTNPCMLPSEQLRLRAIPEIIDSEVSKYRRLEEALEISLFDKNNTYGLFASHDELFSYKKLFKKRYSSNNCFTMVDGHRISNDNIHHKLVPIINDVLEILK